MLPIYKYKVIKYIKCNNWKFLEDSDMNYCMIVYL